MRAGVSLHQRQLKFACAVWSSLGACVNCQSRNCPGYSGTVGKYVLYRARAREYINNYDAKLILNYTRLHEHTHLNSCPRALVVHVYTSIYIEDMRTKKVNECAVTFERIVFS